MWSRDHGSTTRSPGLTVMCVIAIGVWVTPGPEPPPTSPAMTRISAPPSADESSADLARADVLVARVRPLLRGGQVDPQLDAVEQAAGGDQLGRRRLDVQDAGPCRHPLGVAVGDQAAAAVGVLVGEGAVDHVRHRLEAAVGMPGRALGLAGRVLHRAHLVHVDEGVEQPLVDAGEGAMDREALALEALRGGGDGDAPVAARRRRRGR